MIWSLAWIPLLLICLDTVFAGAYLTLHWKSIQAQCRKQSLIAQKKYNTQLQKLVALNPLAKSLRLEKSKALLILSTSTNPVQLAKASAQLALVTKKQKALALKQKILLKTGELQMKATLRHTKFKLPRKLISKTTFNYPHNLKSGLKKSPLKSLTPSYKPVFNFKRERSIKLSWTYSVKKVFFSNQTLWPKQISGDCKSTTLKPTNLSQFSPWKEVLLF